MSAKGKAEAKALPQELEGLDDAAVVVAMRGLVESAQATCVAALLGASRAEAVARAAVDAALSAGARKEAKRAISVLKSRGVAVPDIRATPAAPRAVAAEDVPPSYLSGFDPGGSQMLWAVSVAPGAGLDVVQVAVAPDGCTHDAQRYGVARRRFRDLIDDFRRQADLPVVEVPQPFALWRLAEVKKTAERLHHGVAPKDLASATDLLGNLPAEAPPHPALAAIGGEPVGSASLVRDSAELLSHASFAHWLPESDQLPRLGALVATHSGSVLAGDDRERKIALMRSIVSLIDDQFDAERRARIAQKLRDQALVIAQGDRDEAAIATARMAWATARAIEEASPVATMRPSDIPFLVALMIRPLGPPPAGAKASAADENRLVLTFDEAMAAREGAGAPAEDRRIIL
ncbi:MAG: hypothetical protein IT379_29065 [Deltaproteobacteria bacterium]|nr:hypothetical protein [Deltaproteobacteria bacterium]